MTAQFADLELEVRLKPPTLASDVPGGGTGAASRDVLSAHLDDAHHEVAAHGPALHESLDDVHPPVAARVLEARSSVLAGFAEGAAAAPRVGELAQAAAGGAGAHEVAEGLHEVGHADAQASGHEAADSAPPEWQAAHAKADKPADVAKADKPAEPAAAQKPVEPAAAEKPAEPVAADKPAEPAAAQKAVDPAAAEKPAEPAAAEKPAEPAAAEKPAEPAAAEKPSEAAPAAGATAKQPVAAQSHEAPADNEAAPPPAGPATESEGGRKRRLARDGTKPLFSHYTDKSKTQTPAASQAQALPQVLAHHADTTRPGLGDVQQLPAGLRQPPLARWTESSALTRAGAAPANDDAQGPAARPRVMRHWGEAAPAAGAAAHPAQPTPHAAEPAPHTAQPTPNPAQPTPHAAQPTPETAHPPLAATPAEPGTVALPPSGHLIDDAPAPRQHRPLALRAHRPGLDKRLSGGAAHALRGQHKTDPAHTKAGPGAHAPGAPAAHGPHGAGAVPGGAAHGATPRKAPKKLELLKPHDPKAAPAGADDASDAGTQGPAEIAKAGSDPQANPAQVKQTAEQHKQQLGEKLKGKAQQAGGQARDQQGQANQQGQQAQQAGKQQAQQAGHEAHQGKDEAKAKATVTIADLKKKLADAVKKEEEELETGTKDGKKALETKLGDQEKKLDAEHELDKKKATDEAEKKAKEVDLSLKSFQDKLDAEQKRVADTAKSETQSLQRETAEAKNKVSGEAQKQAEAVLAKGKTEATAVGKAAEAAAEQARTDANARRDSVIQAGGARAQQLRADSKQVEADVVDHDTATRVGTINSMRDARVKEITDKGETDAKKLMTDVETASTKLREDAKTAVAKLDTTLADGIKTIDGKATTAIAKIKTDAATTRTKMEADKATAKAATQKAIDAIEKTYTDGKAKIAKEKTDSIAKIDAEHTKQLAAVKKKQVESEGKLAKATDADAAKLEKQLDADLKAIDAASKANDRVVANQVRQSELRIQADVNQRVATLKFQGNQAVIQIDAATKRALTAIEQKAKPALTQAHKTADGGIAEIHSATFETGEKLTEVRDNAVREAGTTGTTAIAKLDTDSKQSQTDLKAKGAALKGEVDTKLVDDAKKAAERLLDSPGVGPYAGQDQMSTLAMNQLNSLPPDLQDKAVKALDDGHFGKLLTQVPEERRAEFKSLVDNTTDPKRKLKLFAEQHVSQAGKDLNGGMEASSWFDTDEEEKGKKIRNEKRAKILAETKLETADEVKQLEKKLATGSLGGNDINEMIERKRLESDIEKKYLLNITNDREVLNPTTGQTESVKPTARAVWSKEELEKMQSGLMRLPLDHTLNSTQLDEMHRSEIAKRWVADTTPGAAAGAGSWQEHRRADGSPFVAGNHAGGKVTLYDLGVGGKDAAGNEVGQRMSGSTSALANHKAGGTGNEAPLSAIEENMVHEVGHDMHDRNPDAFEKFKQAGGWQKSASDADLKRQLMTDGKLSEADANAKIAAIKSGSEETVNGRRYAKNNEAGTSEPYQSFREKSIPGSPSTTGPYEYADDNAKDHFAETYVKMVEQPEKTHEDLVNGPKADAAAALAARDAAPAGPAREAAQKAYDEAAKTQHDREEQWKIMRNDIFHTDKAVTDSAKDLGDSGWSTSDEKQLVIDEFKEKCAEAGTPEQVERLKKEYKQKVDATP